MVQDARQLELQIGQTTMPQQVRSSTPQESGWSEQTQGKSDASDDLDTTYGKNQANMHSAASQDVSQVTDKSKQSTAVGSKSLLAFCFLGLQFSYIAWGYMQEKVMTKDYKTGKFPSATFCVFSNRVFAMVVGAAVSYFMNGTFSLSAPCLVFAPCSISNSLSSLAQYQVLHYISFPMQTIVKSFKIIPVMIMGKLVNKRTYTLIEYVDALVISAGVCLFSLSEVKGNPRNAETYVIGVLMLAAYIMLDSFTSQWQSRIYTSHPKLDQFQMMFATNAWSLLLTISSLVISGEFWLTLEFLKDNPSAVWDNLVIATTSATGQVFIFCTIKAFGPVVFAIMMTTRQVFSLVLSTVIFGHSIGLAGIMGTLLVFSATFHNFQNKKRR